MMIIGIDPGVETGLAIMETRKNIKNPFLLHYSLLPMKSYISCLDIEEIFKEYVKDYEKSILFHDVKKDDIVIVYIESQYINRNSEKTNWNTLRKLIEIEGFLKYTALKYQCVVKEVFPKQWQSKLLTRQGTRAQLKKISVMRAQTYEKSITNHNIADAVNIANYGWISETKIPFWGLKDDKLQVM